MYVANDTCYISMLTDSGTVSQLRSIKSTIIHIIPNYKLTSNYAYISYQNHK
jgi:hypothetical protein